MKSGVLVGNAQLWSHTVIHWHISSRSPLLLTTEQNHWNTWGSFYPGGIFDMVVGLICSQKTAAAWHWFPTCLIWDPWKENCPWSQVRECGQADYQTSILYCWVAAQIYKLYLYQIYLWTLWGVPGWEPLLYRLNRLATCHQNCNILKSFNHSTALISAMWQRVI